MSCWLLKSNQFHRSDGCLDFLRQSKRIPEPDVTWRSPQNPDGLHNICEDLERWKSHCESHNSGPSQISQEQTRGLNEDTEKDKDSIDGSENEVSNNDTISDDEDY